MLRTVGVVWVTLKSPSCAAMDAPALPDPLGLPEPPDDTTHRPLCATANVIVTSKRVGCTLTVFG